MNDGNILNVGSRIRAIRESRGLSLRVLSKESGLSVNAISLIERGENSPTVSSLQRLATTLEVPITDFFEPAGGLQAVFVEPDRRMRSAANGIIMESLGIGLRQQQMEPFLITLEPEAGTAEQPVTHGGEEFAYCVSGQVEYCVGDQVHQMTPGCSLLFKATVEHWFRNSGTEPAQLLLVFRAEAGSELARRLHLE